MVKNLKKLREEHGLSQQRLAELLDLTQQAIYKYERTSIEPDIDTLIAMADILHTTVDFLIGRDKSEEPRLDLNADEAQCIKHLRKQPPDVRDSFYRLAGSLTSSRKS